MSDTNNNRVTISKSIRELVESEPNGSTDHMSDLVWAAVGDGSNLYVWADRMSRIHPNAVEPDADSRTFYDSDTNNIIFRAFMRHAFQGWLERDTDLLIGLDIVSRNRT